MWICDICQNIRYAGKSNLLEWKYCLDQRSNSVPQHFPGFQLKKICWKDPDEESIEIVRLL
ncbi:hypothetical protein [Membranihabitans maritimus]|uniref:hypothetical protein n=1 Tax=Membranihabitans maritimus TaxID=2904244 RepID=UPI001F157F5C|nr:hypothetical protein [Membranihabitans maritimus]